MLTWVRPRAERFQLSGPICRYRICLLFSVLFYRFGAIRYSVFWCWPVM